MKKKTLARLKRDHAEQLAAMRAFDDVIDIRGTVRETLIKLSRIAERDTDAPECRAAIARLDVFVDIIIAEINRAANTGPKITGRHQQWFELFIVHRKKSESVRAACMRIHSEHPREFIVGRRRYSAETFYQAVRKRLASKIS